MAGPLVSGREWCRQGGSALLVIAALLGIVKPRLIRYVKMKYSCLWVCLWQQRIQKKLLHPVFVTTVDYVGASQLHFRALCEIQSHFGGST